MESLLRWDKRINSEFLLQRLELLKQPYGVNAHGIFNYLKHEYKDTHYDTLELILKEHHALYGNAVDLFDKSSTTTVNIDDLYPCQAFVDKEAVQKKAEGNDNVASSDYPQVIILKDNKHLLIDGHHRICGEVVKGNKTAKVSIKYKKRFSI